MQALYDERYTRDYLSELAFNHDTYGYSYLAGPLMEMISYVKPQSNDERTLFGYLENYFRLRKSWEYMEKSVDERYEKIQPGAVTEAIDKLLEFCEEWNIHACTYDEDNNWAVSGPITRPKDY